MAEEKATKKPYRTVITVVIVIIIVCIVAVIALLGLPSIIFLACMLFMDGEGKLDDAEKISTTVTENQETLQDIVSDVLIPEQDLEVYINVEEKKFQGVGSSRDVEEALFDVNMVIFQTYTDGLSVSGSEQGFFYLDQDFSEDINEYSYFKVYRHCDYSEITDNWYSYDIWY